MMTPDVDTSGILLAVLAMITVYWLWTKTRRSYADFNVPPFPVKPWPVVGHFFMLFGNVLDKLRTWHKNAGDIYSLDLVGQLQVVFNNFDDIKYVWVKQADKIVNILHHFGDDILDECDTGIISGRDANWKEQRTTSISILRSFGMGKNLMAETILQEAVIVNEKLASSKGEAKDFQILINMGVSNVISSVAVGRRFDYEDPDFVSLIRRVNIFIRYFIGVQTLTPLKQVFSLPGDMFHAKKWLQAASEITKHYSKPFVRLYQKEFNVDEDPQNFICAYLKEMKNKKDKNVPTNLDEKNLLAILRTLFTAGAETTSTTILWCLLYMIHYPKVQEKVYREIEANVGTQRLPTMADKSKLTYLKAVINETQRITCLFPLAFKREVTESFEVRGYTVPKGSIVWPVLHSVHFDKRIWGDPEHFRPERFIDEKGALINREELITFGVGRRICMGESLAKMELFLFLAGMFQRFRFEPEDRSGKLPTLEGISGSAIIPHPFKMRFIERK